MPAVSFLLLFVHTDTIIADQGKHRAEVPNRTMAAHLMLCQKANIYNHVEEDNVVSKGESHIVSSQGAEMPEVHRQVGICSNCAYYGNCSFSTMNNGPVFFCSEYVLQGDDAVKVKTDIRGESGVQSSNDNNWECLGLCSTCEHAPYCTMSRREGGVWYCEEFQ